MEWPDSDDEEGLREWIARRSVALGGVELDSATLAEVAVVVRPFNEELAPLAEEYVSVLDRHLKERWARGDFEKAPFSSYGVHTRQGFAFKGFVRDGWAVALTLVREDCPDAVALLERAGVIRRRRDAALHAAFAGR